MEEQRQKAGMTRRTLAGRGTEREGRDIYVPGKCFPPGSSLTVLSHLSFKAVPQRTGRVVWQVPDPRLSRLRPRDH